MPRTLIIDDESDICFLISEILNDEKFICETANNSNQALNKFNNFNPELIILDVWLGKSELDGIQLLKKFKDLNPLVPIIIISGHGTVDMAVNAIKNGAYDFIEKPFNSDKIIVTSKRAIESAKLIKENNKLKSMMAPNTPLIGDSVFINKLKKDLNKIAISNSRIFLSGPNGSGKKLISQIIHQNSNYALSFCSIIDLEITSEEKLKILFSELKNELNENILIQSNNTTLILDNIDALNINYQKKLLFFLENKNFFEKNKFFIKQKIISLTSKNILEEIKKGNFIQALYDRLSAINLSIPPISSRRDDIIPIYNYYLNYYNKNKIFKFSFSKISNARLELYKWPGNVSQIINYAEKTIILNQNLNNTNNFEIENLPLDMGEYEKKSNLENNYELSLKEARVNFEKDYLLSQIKRFNGNIVKISAFTGMERTALYRKFKSLNIDIENKL
jgi:two-component system nitrogen regulation response regulator NtrX